ncbi:MAG: UDP-N-acetylmuramoyl-L-alanyl-D-glutamate--2,6-diaminopimelate ligase [Synergistaceae bacterium]|nr:UDP-N-acetylmuramoyl-L-alanyl-D-glutamate--2,6-diaminopimelate ligase [Synergistaceae bacterium]
MKIKELLAKLEKSDISYKIWLSDNWDPANDTEISQLVSDSRKVIPGSIFACVKGDHTDGHDYAEKAFRSGASVLLCEHKLDIQIPQIISEDVRRNMGLVASLLYDEPAKKLKMIALTGTNGKTTSTFMTKSILDHSGIKTGLLGTIYYDDGDSCADAEHTTPEGSDLQHWLSRMAANGCEACVMETSSHAIVQGRLEGVLFDRAGFTNLTVDHLDYHKNMESYFAAKRTLFEKYMRNNWMAAVNSDDEYGCRLLSEFGSRTISYGTKDRNSKFYADIIGTSIEGMDVRISTPDSKIPVASRLPLLGEYNIMNALQALSICWSLGVRDNTALEGLLLMKQVPGRLERYIIPGSGTCVIDFAHSPDSLEKVIRTLRSVCKGKLLVVFGAGGDRDKTKRPIMGEIAARLADSVIITSDNPRSEDPETIVSEIEEGAQKHSQAYSRIVDRRSAIFEGLNKTGPDDILLIAGKGPEPYQILKDGPIPFLDKNVMTEWCRENGKEVL